LTRSARIALARPIRRLFDYQVPAHLDLEAGQRVRIPFGRQTAIGLVVDPDAEAPPNITLKPIASVMEYWPALPPETLRLLTWASRYYQHPLGECLFMALPPALRRGRMASRRQQTCWHVTPGTTGDLPANARRQRALLSWLQDQPGPVPTKAAINAGFTRAQLNALRDRGLVGESMHDQTAGAVPETSGPESLPRLSPAQSSAFHQLPAPAEGFTASLLYGITGSGKTEIYLHYLEQFLGQDRQGLVLVPEINLTPQTVARFSKYFGNRIAVWHSSLNDSERLDAWLRIRDGEPVIVIGTRSAVMLPFTRLAMIVVDEEHDSSYKQGEGFRYSGRDLAVYRASLNRCPVILGSATPSLESLHNAQTGKYRLIRLEERAGDALPPEIHLLDIRSRPLQGGISAPALKAIEACLAAGKQALVFVNRRGYAPVMMCFDCGHITECPRCDHRLTYHRGDNAMRCHHCDFQMAASSHCPACKSEAFKPIGQGTERTEEVLSHTFPETPIIRVDRDTTQRKGSIQAIIREVSSGRPCILVGTQMLAKGHDFPGVTLVVVINADGGLFSVDFRAPEQMVQTLLQVSGRAGRGREPGRVLIQTCHSDHPLIQALSKGDYLPLAKQLLEERSGGEGFPPFRAMALVRAEAPTMAASMGFLDEARRQLNDPAIAVWGPLPALMARRADRHRAQLVLITGNRSRLNHCLATLCRVLDDRQRPPNLRWQVDVDPMETG
jgi:primosomal protein N' (replication factor Y)